MLANVHRLHETIDGELPEAAGVHPAGTPYSAFDPELMLWTLAVIADSGRAMYEAMVRPLSAGRAARTSGRTTSASASSSALPRSEVPASYREFKAWFDGKLASPDLHATEHALEMAPMVAFEQPVPAAARGNLALQNHIIKGTLPPRVREIFGIRWGRRARALVPGGRPPPTAAPAAPSRTRCAAVATTTSSTSSSRSSSAARRHQDARSSPAARRRSALRR